MREKVNIYDFTTDVLEQELSNTSVVYLINHQPKMGCCARAREREKGLYILEFSEVESTKTAIIHEVAHVLLWALENKYNHGHGADYMRMYEYLENKYL